LFHSIAFDQTERKRGLLTHVFHERWTNDPILRDNFFCNTYRVLDKLSQYLISEVIEKGPQTPEEVVFRVLLFHSFTRIETWELLAKHCGPLEWKTYNHNKYKKVLEDAFKAGQTLYTSAFIKPAPHFVSSQNYVNHLHLLETMMNNQLAFRILGAPYLADVYEYIISFPSMGPFMTYQLMLCLSYSDVLNFHHNDFVIAGPGSISGLNKLFGKKSMAHGRTTVVNFEAEVMRYMANTQDEHFKRLGLEFSGLGPQRLPMGVADIEHTLCEVDKYCRAAHPELQGKKKHLVRLFKPPPTAYTPSAPSPAILPKAWSHPARRTPRIREDKVLKVEKRYEVEHLADHRDTPNGKQYFVYWVGYSAKDASWEFESSLLQDTPESVEEYLASLKKGRSRTSKKRN